MWLVQERKEIYTVFGGNLTEESQLGRPRLRWKYNLKMGLKEIILTIVEWICAALDNDIW
jgi:hypothetical protein